MTATIVPGSITPTAGTDTWASTFATAQTYEMERQRDMRTNERIDDRPDLVTRREIPPPRVLTTTDVASVEQRRDQVLKRNLVGRKLTAADYQELRRQRTQVDALIARMRAGHPVSSESVDRALGLYDQNRPGY